MTRRRALVVPAMLAFAAAFVFAFGRLEAETGHSETTAPARAANVARGEYLVRAGGCMACHTADAARPFAGGRAMPTRFGIFYTPNITSDRATGIGAWTDAQFVRAMREGIGRNGEHLYPTFPYTAYTRLSDGDVLAMRAYLATVPPVRYAPPPHALRFPFNWRWLMIAWNAFNFSPGRFVPDPGKRAEWNRGAYLVEALAHCGQCHTPRNVLGGLKNGERLGGATVAGWRAGNLTPERVAGIGAWRDDELLRYLASGAAPGRAYAIGPMAEVVASGTQFLTGDDLRAMVTYLRSMPVVGAQSGARSRWGFGAAAQTDITTLDAVGAFERRSGGSGNTADKATSSGRDRAGAEKAPDSATSSERDGAGAENTPDSAKNPDRAKTSAVATPDVASTSHRDTAGAAKTRQTATTADPGAASSANPEGARLYAAACASCHGATGESTGGPFPSLVHDGVTAALGSMDTSNLVLVILHGVDRETRDAPALMPAFGASLSDANIAALSNYLTRQFGDPRATTRAEDVARLRAIAQ
ncbi:putative Gluconate 2-dehydrogenase (acceptor) [Burkholderia sp. 8Y]|uniref:cytochrome c n=1 Tax=Burkholderia sp. 8Y TaxID=2653133 RepID=UPI0012F1C87C|nr:cytochrome c [Burkholderia sp. 8Y]VXB81907.1 putative Gluconate 2-dehydrogenase (acceptor) [Burkholderia sp. 8Y]